jgi:hypothetical protein
LYHIAIFKSCALEGMGALIAQYGYARISQLNVWSLFVWMVYLGRIFHL